MRAPGATPAKPVTGSRPAIRPARWVPWPKVSSVASRAVAPLGREVGSVDDAAGLGEPADRHHAGVDQRHVDAGAVGRARHETRAAGDPLHRVVVAASAARAEAGSRSAIAASPRAAIRASFGRPRPSQRIP